MWNRLFHHNMQRLIRLGALEISLPDGSIRRYGEDDTEPVRVTIHDPDLPRRLLLTPDMALGEAYMDRRLTIENDDLRGFLELALANRGAGHEPAIMRAWNLYARPAQRWLAHNRRARSQSNVAHHYDLSAGLYDLFLDTDRQYSCAYFTDPDQSLEVAQEAKKHHIAHKLCLRTDMRVLDIGCGWGGMAITLARDYGARVLGVTLSEEQRRSAVARVAEAGLTDRIDIRLQDYRQITGSFDRIVSVGMFEHVGAPHFRAYFDKVRSLLSADGIALIHTIGSARTPRATSPWIRRYIFPGGYIPAMSETVAAIEKEQLIVADVEVLRLHYAWTLRHWTERFEAQIDTARALYDDRFCRMWRYYLIASEMSFRNNAMAVFQFQLERRHGVVPFTRDYLYVPQQKAAEGMKKARRPGLRQAS
jgi:cyclopropane-fatty-acyl-phospholipid synthase